MKDIEQKTGLISEEELEEELEGSINGSGTPSLIGTALSALGGGAATTISVDACPTSACSKDCNK